MPSVKDTVFYTLLDIAKIDKNVVVLSCDTGAYALKDFPEGQFFNVGVAEQNTMSVAAGLALEGKRAFVYGIIPFVTMRCLEQIKMDICVHNASVCILGIGTGYSYSYDGPSHHAVEDIAIMRAMPGMTIYSPSSYAMAAAMVRSAYNMKSPCYIRLDNDALLEDNYYEVDAGYRIVANGYVYIAASGAEVKSVLENVTRGQGVGVIDFYRLKPMPNISALRILEVYDEHSLVGGLRGAIMEGTQYPEGHLGKGYFHLDAGSRRYIRWLEGLW